MLVLSAVVIVLSFSLTVLAAVYHTVAPGDTLYLVARQYNVTVKALKQANSLRSDTLYPGQTLIIPKTTTDSAASGGQQHVVGSGDTLWLISVRYGVSVQSLKVANSLVSDYLYVGQVLLIPQGTGTQTGSPGTFAYTVKTGDTLYLLAQRFGTTISAIKTASNLTSDALYVGQVLQVPGSSTEAPVEPVPSTPDTQTISVQSGDTLFLLAQRYGTTVNEIKTANNLTSDVLNIGQNLVIPVSLQEPVPAPSPVPESPAPAPESPVPAPESPNPVPPAEEQTTQMVYLHQVRWNQTLNDIATNYGVSEESIMSSNRLQNDTVRSWMALMIERPSRNESALTAISLPDSISVTDYHKLARMTYAESGSEPYSGQVSVAAVILNRLESPLFPNTMDAVLVQPWQFEAMENGYYYQAVPTLDAYRAAAEAVNGVDPTNGALFFYNPTQVTNQWLLSKPVTYQVGDHVFAR